MFVQYLCLHVVIDELVSVICQIISRSIVALYANYEFYFYKITKWTNKSENKLIGTFFKRKFTYAVEPLQSNSLREKQNYVVAER